MVVCVMFRKVLNCNMIGWISVMREASGVEWAAESWEVVVAVEGQFVLEELSATQRP